MKRVVYHYAEERATQRKKDAASNPNTSQQVLTKLANDDDWKVRCFVARNPRASKAVLQKLANDREARVRECVATNPNASQDILDSINNYVKDYDEYEDDWDEYDEDYAPSAENGDYSPSNP